MTIAPPLSRLSLPYQFYHVLVILNHFLVYLSHNSSFTYLCMCSLSQFHLSQVVPFPDHWWLLHETSLPLWLSLSNCARWNFSSLSYWIGISNFSASIIENREVEYMDNFNMTLSSSISILIHVGHEIWKFLCSCKLHIQRALLWSSCVPNLKFHIPRCGAVGEAGCSELSRGSTWKFMVVTESTRKVYFCC